MDYEKTETFRGNIGKVLEVAKTAFIQHNFQIVRHSDEEVEFTGPVRWIHLSTTWLLREKRLNPHI